MSDFTDQWANRHDGECEVQHICSPMGCRDSACHCYRRWLEGRLGEIGKHVRLFLVAPSGTTICACHNTHAVAAGLERPCWYCVARSLLPPKGAGDE